MPTHAELLDKMKQLNPHSLLIIGYWQGGNIEVSVNNTPLEVLSYMHQMLGLVISDRLSQAMTGPSPNK